ncbi:hypothetical protein [Gallaecimonas sp. GXIMD4217]|uniref:hypothetical protein n=1 Tax=Gallaecimonas sp. GXIMD4217 TaxID=3131927 RepID=UPI00311AD6E2
MRDSRTRLKGLAVGLLFSVLAPSASAIEDWVVPPLMRVDKMSQTEYAHAWWQWIKSVPSVASPLSDRTGERCDLNQRGLVWFLANSNSKEPVERFCEIPKDKYLFVPILTQLAEPRMENEKPCAEMKAASALHWPHIEEISLVLDGQEVTNLAAFRQKSRKCFDVLGGIPRERLPPKLYPAATQGYWVMLRPLEAGEHELRIRAKYRADHVRRGLIEQDVTYKINSY